MSGDRPKSIPLNELSAKVDEAAKDVLRDFKPLATADLSLSFFPDHGTMGLRLSDDVLSTMSVGELYKAAGELTGKLEGLDFKAKPAVVISGGHGTMGFFPVDLELNLKKF